MKFHLIAKAALALGTLVKNAALAKVTASPTALCRQNTARRFSLIAQAIASKANMPNADCSCCIPAFPIRVLPA